MRKLNLDELKPGQPGLSPKMAEILVEAAVICLVLNGHQSGVTLSLVGNYKENFQLIWSDGVTEQQINTWKDKNEATEYGASAIAILLIFVLEQLVVRERLPQDGNSDYALSTIDSSNYKGQLEVSGIWKESKGNRVKDRVRVKINKLKAISNIGNFPIYVIVTEFSNPKSRIKKYGK